MDVRKYLPVRMLSGHRDHRVRVHKQIVNGRTSGQDQLSLW